MAETPPGQTETTNWPLSEKERFWSDHFRQWEQSGQSLAGYARSRGLVVKTFYGWHDRLKKRGLARPGPAAPIFHRVTVKKTESPPIVAEEAVHFRFQLPNGIRCETDLSLNDVAGFLERLSRIRP